MSAQNVTIRRRFGTLWYVAPKGAKSCMKMAAANAGAQCLVQLTDPDTGHNHFGYYRTWQQCIQATNVIPENRRHLFEMIPDGKPCKGYLDIDSTTLPQGIPDITALVHHLEALVTRVYAEDYGIQLPPGACVWLHSPNPEKISLHLTISTHSPMYVFKCNKDKDEGAYELARRMIDLDPDVAGKVVDPLVYSADRVMRMQGSCKYGHSSVLVPLQGTATDMLPDAIITWLDSKDVQIIKVPKKVPAVVKKEVRLLKTPAEARIMTPKDESARAIMRMLELLQAEMHPTAYHDPTHGDEDANDPLKGIKFNYRCRSEPCYTGNVHTGTQNLRCFVDNAGDVYAKCYSARCADCKPVRLGRLYVESTRYLATAVHIDTPYLAVDSRHSTTTDVIMDRMSECPTFDNVLHRWVAGTAPRVLSIKSPMGTGKSTLLDVLLKRMPPSTTVLMVTYRQTLAMEQQRKLANHNFVNYMAVGRSSELSDRKRHPRVICQVESMWKLGVHLGGAHTFDVVIMDEVESVLRHHASPTVKAPHMTMAILVALMQAAKRGIITMDAFWGAATHEFLEELQLSNQLVINAHRPPPRTFSFTNDGDWWQQRIVDDLKAGVNVVLASMSTERIFRVKDALLSTGVLQEKDILMHTSKTDDAIKASLVNVDALWSNYRFVAYSPTISAGVDFSTAHFHRMYLYVCTMSCSPLGTMQMTGRVRKLEDRTVRCCAAPNVRIVGSPTCRPMTSQIMHSYLTWMDASMRTQEAGCAPCKVEGGDVMLLPPSTPLLAIQAHQESEAHNSRTRFFFEFTDMAKTAGNNVEVERVVRPSKPTDLITAPKAASEQRLLDARDLSNEELEEVRGRIYNNKASEDDKWDFYRANYKCGWGVDCIDADFVSNNGTEPRSAEAQQLIRVLTPNRHVSADVPTAERSSILRAPHIADTLRALGFRSPFDTYHKITDLMARWDSQIRNIDMFKHYKTNARLFRGKAIKDEEWDLNKVVKAINMVLGVAGLKIACDVARTTINKTRTRSYTYYLDKECVQEMLELVKLRIRTSSEVIANEHARSALMACEMVRYGHLVDAGTRTHLDFTEWDE